MQATHHGRDQVAYVKIGATRDGTITAFHAKIIADLGEYLMLLTPTIPSLGAFVMSGVYDIPNVQTDIVGVFTNNSRRTPSAARAPRGDAHDRGPGRPARGRAGHGPARAAAQELHGPGVVPARDRARRRLRLGRLPRDPGQAARAHRPGGREGAGAGRQAPRRGLLHLHGDLRPGALARHRPVRLRPADRPVGVGDGARAHHGRGDRVHRHLAARPGAGDHARPGGGRPARHRPAERRGHPRRHGHGPAGARDLRVALHRRGRRGGRPGDAEDRREGAADRGPPARGRATTTSSCATASSPSRARPTGA